MENQLLLLRINCRGNVLEPRNMSRHVEAGIPIDTVARRDLQNFLVDNRRWSMILRMWKKAIGNMWVWHKYDKSCIVVLICVVLSHFFDERKGHVPSWGRLMSHSSGLRYRASPDGEKNQVLKPVPWGQSIWGTLDETGQWLKVKPGRCSTEQIGESGWGEKHRESPISFVCVYSSFLILLGSTHWKIVRMLDVVLTCADFALVSHHIV